MSAIRLSGTMNLQVEGADEDVPRILQLKLKKVGDSSVGGYWLPLLKTMVFLRVDADHRHFLWKPLADSDCPFEWVEITYQEASALLKGAMAQAETLNQKGPSATRGNWQARLTFSGDVPELRLSKAITSYQTVVFASSPEGWVASVEKKDKWFQTEGTKRIGVYPIFADAVPLALAAAISEDVAASCALRDSSRRAVVDPAHHASLADLRRSPSVPRVEATTLFPDRSAPRPSRASKKIRPSEAPPAVENIPASEPPSCPASVQKILAATEQEADALAKLTDSYWAESEPVTLLTRAGKLIRQAQSLISSPHCTGDQRERALADLRLAAKEYEDARQTILRGGDVEAAHVAKRVAERIALAAARAAKSCASGSPNLVSLGESRQEIVHQIREQERQDLATRGVPRTAPRPTAGPSRPPAAPSLPSDLVVVPIGTPIRSSSDLALRLALAANNYRSDPSAAKAKALVRSALLQLGRDVPLAKISSSARGTGDSRYQEVSIQDDVSDTRLISEALLSLGLPIRLATGERRAPAPSPASYVEPRPAPSPASYAEPRPAPPIPSPYPEARSAPPIPSPYPEARSAPIPAPYPEARTALSSQPSYDDSSAGDVKGVAAALGALADLAGIELDLDL